MIHFSLSSTVSIGAVRTSFDGRALSRGRTRKPPPLNGTDVGAALEALFAKFCFAGVDDARGLLHRRGRGLGRPSHTTCALADRRRHRNVGRRWTPGRLRMGAQKRARGKKTETRRAVARSCGGRLEVGKAGRASRDVSGVVHRLNGAKNAVWVYVMGP